MNDIRRSLVDILEEFGNRYAKLQGDKHIEALLIGEYLKDIYAYFDSLYKGDTKCKEE